MKIIITIIFLLSFCFLFGQHEIISLQDTSLNATSRFHRESDSISTKEGIKYEYFSLKSSDLIPSIDNLKDIRIRLKTSKNGTTTIKQYLSDENESCWASVFKDNSKYEILFQNSTNPLEKFYSSFNITKQGNELIFSTNKAFYGQLQVKDSILEFIVRPYIIFKSNIKLIKNIKKISTLEFGESFEILDSYFSLSNLQLSSKSITLEAKSYEEGRFGYKSGKLVENFEDSKRHIRTNLIDKGKAIYSTEYYLLYFWGEWCHPCLKKIESNKKLFAKLNLQKVNLINIALSRNQQSKLNTINLIQKNQILGFHIIENQTSLSDGLIQKLNVSTYPSYIIIDRKGMIIFRSDELNSNKQLEEVLIEKGLL